MATHNETGKEGEAEACEHLEKKGYKIIAKNWRFERAEIDILAQIQDILVVVEVKTRTSLDFGLPQDFVKPAQIKNLCKAVDAYIQLNDLDLEIRFDIIAIYKSGNKMDIEHLEDAFYYF
ncbi:MAG: YraN family protein [Flavobacterium sp.]|jgi:putative endonuclease